MNIPALITFMVGAILLYAAIKNRDPRDVVKEAFKPVAFGSGGKGGGGW